MLIITIIGARPQFIKAAALSREIIKNNLINKVQKIKELIVHTGQHFDEEMSKCFFDDLEIPKPIINLGIGGKSHGAGTGQMIEAIEKILLDYKPNYVLVYGDTNSTLAGAIAATKLNIPILHVEAGLRSYNRLQPEEKNRFITDYLSEICFAPTNSSVKNLLKENIQGKRIFNCGDIMADVFRIYKNKIDKNTKVLKKLNLKTKKYCVVTIHREENTDQKKYLENILLALAKTEKKIVFPIHPRTKSRIKKFKLEHYLNNLQTCDPLSYFDMMKLVKDAVLIITDSGGLQKEAYLNRVPCLTLRKSTEWIETLNTGWNLLSFPINHEKIVKDINRQMNLKTNDMNHPNLYGEGYAASLIIEFIKKLYYGNK